MLKVNSKLVLARVSGFGSVSGQFGGDVVFAAMSGAMSTIDKKPEDLENALKEAHGKVLKIWLINLYVFSLDTCGAIAYYHGNNNGNLKCKL